MRDCALNCVGADESIIDELLLEDQEGERSSSGSSSIMPNT